MPQGKGTYGSKKGRPPKRIKRVKKKKTGFVKAAKSIERRGTEGTFTAYCGGKVTDACIKKGLAAGGLWAKRAAFAKAAKSIAKNK